MEIIIDHKIIRAAALIFLTLFSGLVAAFFLPGMINSRLEQKSQMPADAQAAVDGTTAFYTLDYTEPPNLWQERVCAYTTKNGCRAIREFFAASVQASVDENRVQTFAMAQPVKMVADLNGRRIWQLDLTLTNPWNDETSRTQDVYVEVEMENGEWRLNRVLFEQEAAQFITHTP